MRGKVKGEGLSRLISRPPGPDICTTCNRRACEKAWQDAVEIDRATVVASMANA